MRPIEEMSEPYCRRLEYALRRDPRGRRYILGYTRMRTAPPWSTLSLKPATRPNFPRPAGVIPPSRFVLARGHAPRRRPAGRDETAPPPALAHPRPPSLTRLGRSAWHPLVAGHPPRPSDLCTPTSLNFALRSASRGQHPPYLLPCIVLMAAVVSEGG